MLKKSTTSKTKRTKQQQDSKDNLTVNAVMDTVSTLLTVARVVRLTKTVRGKKARLSDAAALRVIRELLLAWRRDSKEYERLHGEASKGGRGR